MSWNLCKGCGCRLDPGEGYYCEDCLEEREQEEEERYTAAKQNNRSKELVAAYA